MTLIKSSIGNIPSKPVKVKEDVVNGKPNLQRLLPVTSNNKPFLRSKSDSNINKIIPVIPINDTNGIESNVNRVNHETPPTKLHIVPGTKKYSKAHVRNTLIVSDTYIQVHTVPGTKKYSKAHVRNTLIVSDSMINRIHVNKLKNNIDFDCEDIILKKFSGATADEISHYVSHPLQMIQPSQMIIIAGTNDISNGCRDRSLNEYKVVNDILNIARKAKTFGTNNIYISSIIVRWGYQYGNIITRINNLLENSCREEGLLYLDHLDITMRHISNDGLHLNIYGNTIMKMNLLKCFYSFNPFLCHFDKFYDYAL